MSDHRIAAPPTGQEKIDTPGARRYLPRIKRAVAILLLAGCASTPASPAPKPTVDDLLGNRQNPGYAGVICGSVGRRLWCQGLALAPGLLGNFQYLHNSAWADSLATLDVIEGAELHAFDLKHRWWPSHVEMSGESNGLRLVERKFITADDRAVDLVTLTNASDRPRSLHFVVASPKGLDGKHELFGVPFTHAVNATGFRPWNTTKPVHAAVGAKASASFTYNTDAVAAAIDGQHNPDARWTCWSSGNRTDWFTVDFGERDVTAVDLDLFDDRQGVWLPEQIDLEARVGGEWRAILQTKPTKTRFELPIGTRCDAVRLTFHHREGKYSGLVELEVLPGKEIPVRALQRQAKLAPGESVDFAVVFACDRDTAAPTLEEHLAEWNGWFDRNVPDFDCPDSAWVKLWYFRWYVVRHCLAEPRAGLLKEPCFFEGRHMDWYPRVITYGHPHQLMEARWLRDPRFAIGHVKAVFDNQLASGIFPNVQVDRAVAHYYTEWIATEPWELHKVHPNRALVDWALPRMERNVAGLLAQFDRDDDRLLQVTDSHFHTGMEFQPSFFWFNADKRDTSREVPVERVDYTSYLYANMRAVAEANGRDMPKLDFIEQMWRDDFYYSCLPATNEPARVKEIVGFYPLAFGASKRADILDLLFDDAEFWAKFPACSATKKAEFYSQTEPNACHWNGPSWPHANSIVAEAVAKFRPARLFEFLDAFQRSQWQNGHPHVGEFYNSDTGEWQTPTEDYFHSTWADLLIRHVAGLTPRADDVLELDPKPTPWSHWKFAGVPYHGALLDIVWDKPDGVDVYSDGVEGYTVRRNGVEVFSSPALKKWP